ncbi:MAG: cytochrome C [Solirubrobacterales bacterium]
MHRPIWRLALLGLTAIAAAVMLHRPAEAVPAFSHQTGQACAACHVGAMGPQLTPYGRAFKLSGFSDGQGKSDYLPLSVMVDASFAHTQKKQAAADVANTGYGVNDNAAVDEVGLFYAGRIYDHLGALAQVTWEWGGNVHRWSWDNTDIRYGRDTTIAGLDSTVGVSVNNAPTVSDIFNSTPTWGYPYQGSGAAPSPTAAALLEDGLGGKVVGATAYGLFADTVYAEAGGYLPLGGSQQDWLGVKVDDGPQLHGLAPYWRLALQRNELKQNFSVGTFGLIADVYPNNDRSQGTDTFRDYGFDATYQWLGNRTHVFTANAVALFERRDLSASQALGGADRSHTNLNTYRVNGSYWYDQTYGLTLGGFKTTGNADAAFYGTANGRPNSTGYIAEIDWAPFGKKDSWMQPWVNLKIGLQYVGYTKFDGAGTNYDGNGRDASDNNTIMLLMRTAF